MLIEVFKSGNHTDAAGNKKYYSPETLEQIVRQYNERITEFPFDAAPLVKGHPKTDAPALGWVEKLMRHNDKIIAKIDKIDASLANEMKDGKYKHFSIALQSDLTLRHIGIIGAVPPAIKGLNKNGIVYFNNDNEYADYSEYTFAVGSRRSKSDYNEFENINNPNSEATANIEHSDGININNIISQTAELISENEKLKSEISVLQNEIDELKNINQKLVSNIQAHEKETRLASYREYANSLLTSSSTSLTPSQVPVLVDVLESAYYAGIEKQNENSEFSYSDENVDLVGKIKYLMSTLANATAYNEVLDSLEFSESATINSIEQELQFEGINTDKAREHLHISTLNYMSANPNISYDDALLHCSEM